MYMCGIYALHVLRMYGVWYTRVVCVWCVYMVLCGMCGVCVVYVWMVCVSGDTGLLLCLAHSHGLRSSGGRSFTQE